MQQANNGSFSALARYSSFNHANDILCEYRSTKMTDFSCDAETTTTTRSTSSSSTNSTTTSTSTNIHDLPHELLRYIFIILGGGMYRFIAPVSKFFLQLYTHQQHSMHPPPYTNTYYMYQTTLQHVVSSPSCTLAKMFLHEAGILNGNLNGTPNGNGCKAANNLQSLCNQAAKYGQLPILQWTKECGWSRWWTEETAALASQGGHLSVLQYLRRNGCPWNKEVCTRAARYNQLIVLKWATSTDNATSTRKWDNKMCVCAAARHGHLEILRWLWNENESGNGSGRWRWDKSVCEAAAAGGHLDVIKWLMNDDDNNVGRRIEWDTKTCRGAASGGHLEVLKWLRGHGNDNNNDDTHHGISCPWDKTTCSQAAYGGHLEVLKWARFQGCEWDKQTCSFAAKGGHLELLQWARGNGCEWDTSTCSMAARYGHFIVFRWATENGCGWDWNIDRDAERGGDSDIIDYVERESNVFRFH